MSNNDQFFFKNVNGKYTINGEFFRFVLDQNRGGEITRIDLFDGLRWVKVNKGSTPGLEFKGRGGHVYSLANLGSAKIELVEDGGGYFKFEVKSFLQINGSQWMVEKVYEAYKEGILFCNTKISLLEGAAELSSVEFGISLDEGTVFSQTYDLKNLFSSPNEYEKPAPLNREFQVNFSTDKRPVTNSINLFIEKFGEGMAGVKPNKIYLKEAGSRKLGWDLLNSISRFEAPYEYSNLWGICFGRVGLHNRIRGQRIYHWYGMHPRYPPERIIDEMAEYGCSLLVLHHSWSRYLGDWQAYNEEQLLRVIKRCREHGIKVLLYIINPALLSMNSPDFHDLESDRSGSGWRSSSEKRQNVFYETYLDYDCDLMCLASKAYFKYTTGKVKAIWEKYDFDGFYHDGPEPSICENPAHDHPKEIFCVHDNFMYYRFLRDLVGKEGILIGHSGNLVSTLGMLGYDGNLTGEAQADLDPYATAQYTSAAPMLWPAHRHKAKIFRSQKTVARLVREGITPHITLGIMGFSVIASHDPAYFSEILPLWQMWRSIPIERATFFNYLTEQVVRSSNPSFASSVYKVSEQLILLITANLMEASGKTTLFLDKEKLGMKGIYDILEMKGKEYRSFAVKKVGSTSTGKVITDEVEKHQLRGYLFIKGKYPPHVREFIQKEFQKKMEYLESLPTSKGNLAWLKINRINPVWHKWINTSN
jgi:hypothetical protein